MLLAVVPIRHAARLTAARGDGYRFGRPQAVVCRERTERRIDVA